jgi:hypothetical protein
VNRRQMLSFGFGALAVTAIPLTKMLAPKVPIIYGDGNHDDTPGLQAALDGRDFIALDSKVKVTNGRLELANGHYRLTQSIWLGEKNSIVHTVANGNFYGPLA